MQQFFNRSGYRTTSDGFPAGKQGLDQVNVGQFSWTENDIAGIKDLLTYIEMSQRFAERSEAAAQVSEAAKSETESIRDNYKVIVADIDTKHAEVVRIQASVQSDKTLIDQKVANVTNLSSEMNLKYDQVQDWHNEIMQYRMMAVLSASTIDVDDDDTELSVNGGSVQDITLSVPTTKVHFMPFTDATNTSRQVTLILRQGTGNNKVTWADNIIWNDNKKPVLSTNKNNINVISLLTTDSGRTWLGLIGGNWF